MGTVNYTNPGTDPTVRVFDEFYNRELVIDANTYDSVLSFFSSIFADEEASKNFTLSVFKISEDSGTPVESILSELSNQNQIQIDTMAHQGYFRRKRGDHSDQRRRTSNTMMENS